MSAFRIYSYSSSSRSAFQGALSGVLNISGGTGGTTGPTGPAGKDGIIGKDGATGPNGTTGVGIRTITVTI